MTPERWARVTELFDQACEMAPAKRRAWLDTACDDDAVRAEVDAMLTAYETDPEYLEQPTDATGAMEHAVADALVGRRLGAYRLVSQIGRGGMGVVYEAHRDDQEFDRRAAIKVLPVWRSAAFGERFRLERRVLAGLDHPGIARLIDAGATADGVTYLVMEYVDGQPLTAWCDVHAAGLRERVALIERVCDAVAYAHQHLVIHRDLKPANILVTAAGEPKLLDFGIAALVADDGASAGTTRTGQHSFTPEYASPEQVRGERVTTASDVYSLGVLLYVVLTGRHPYALAGLSPLEVMRTVCEVDPPPPSRVAAAEVRRRLAGDLDAIVGKALRKPAADRYASVAELAADLRAWQGGHPVVAAPASFGYRARRFVGRNRKAVAAGIAVTLALVGGGVATAWQARVAQVERDKAQNRFRQIEEFSRSLLFDVHGALRNVPGATEARRMLLDRSVTFLDGLSADAGDDPALKRALAAGYEQLANVQGSNFTQNLGDPQSALASLDKAAGYIDALHVDEPQDAAVLALAINIHFDRAAMLNDLDDPRESAEMAAHAALVEELETRHPHTPEVLTAVAKGYSDIGRLLADNGRFDEAERAYRHAVQLYGRLAPADKRVGAVANHAFALKRLGAVLMRRLALDESEQRYREALALDEEAIRRDDRPQTRYDITFTLSDLALVQARRERWDDAEALWRRALSIREAAVASDPRDVRALSGVSVLYGRLGTAAHARRDYPAAVAAYRQEVSRRERLVELSGKLPGRTAELSWARLRLAEALLNVPTAEGRAGRVAEARRLVAATTRTDGKPSVPAGSEPGYLDLYDQLAARLNPR